jgi:integration host factor subunit alpha
LARAVQETVVVSNSEAADLVDNILKALCQTLSSGQDVKIQRFGNFHIRQKGARLGRNPKTGEAATIAPRRVLTFKASEQFRDRLRGRPAA